MTENPGTNAAHTHPAHTSTWQVDGMTCDHCVGAVTAELTDLPAVTDVAVQLVAGGTSTVTLTSETPLDREEVAAAVDEAGYALARPGSLPMA